jgi:hypothetical protein
MAASLHEDFQSERPVKSGSDRSFGLVMAAAFLLIAGAKLWHAAPSWPIFAAVSALFAAAALVVPAWLAPLNRLWFRFGLVLHKVVGPVVMAGVFFAVVTPIGLLMRVCGQRPLPLGFDAAARSYWLARTQPTAPPGSMRRQY